MGIWDTDDRIDYYEITDERIKQNADSVALVCIAGSLTSRGRNYVELRTKNFGKAFGLIEFEPFRDQPVTGMGSIAGFLVKEDVVATAAHFADHKNVKNLYFIFGYRMESPYSPVTQIPKRDVYKGKEIVGRVYDPTGVDWALVKLDRSVDGRQVIRLSEKEIVSGQEVYTIGYPCGLPLKYSLGSVVRQFGQAIFSVGLDIYAGNSGNPVFDVETHEVLGMVVRGHNEDFRYTGKGYVSAVHSPSDRDVKAAECTRVTQIMRLLQ